MVPTSFHRTRKISRMTRYHYYWEKESTIMTKRIVWRDLTSDIYHPKNTFIAWWSDADYNHATLVLDCFNCQNTGDYNDLYLMFDVLLLSDVFETSWNVYLKAYNLDRCHFYISPGLAWQTCLKITDVELELLTDSDMFLFMGEGLRGGIFMTSNRFSNANNPYLPKYDPSILFDAPLCTLRSQPLPTDEFVRLTSQEMSTLDVEGVLEDSEKEEKESYCQ